MFCLELQFWIFFHQFMTLSQRFWDLVDLFWVLFSKMPSTSPQDLLKECFFLEKPHTCLSFSNFERKLSVNWLRCFSRTVRIVFYVSKWTLRMKNFFKKNISSLFSGLWLEIVRISSVSFRQLWQNCIYVSIGMFWGKQMISERDVFFREFSWKKIGPSLEFFRRFVKTTFKVSRGKLWESY